MTITYTIPGATLLDQLNEGTMDGQIDENANDNCVAASLAEALHILTGRTFDGDELKDAVYGQGYVGTQSAARYVSYCANQGVSLTAYSALQAGLVVAIHEQVSAGHPVLVTMPSQWGTAPADPVHPSGSTHVGVAVGVGPGAIRVMNPWHGFWQDQSDDWWAARLCYGQVWPMQKVSNSVAAGDATPFYGLVYTADAQVWHCPSTNCDLGHGFLNFYQGVNGPQGESATEILGLPKSNEYSSGTLVKQNFERCRLVYDGSKGNPWMIYLDHIDGDLAAGAAAVKQVSDLQSQLASAQANVTAIQQQRDALSAQLASAQAQITTLQQQLAAANAPHDNPQADAALAALQAFKAALAAS